MRTRRPRRRSPGSQRRVSTSWGCTRKPGRPPLHRPPGAPPAMPTCLAASWGPLRPLLRVPQAISSVGRPPCSSQALPLPQGGPVRPVSVSSGPAGRSSESGRAGSSQGWPEGACAELSAPALPLGSLLRGSWGEAPGRGCAGSWRRVILGLRGRRCPALWAQACKAPYVHLLSGCLSAADPFDPLLLTSDADAQPCSKPDVFGEFLNSDALAAPSASFPSTHSAPPPTCSATFQQLGE